MNLLWDNELLARLKQATASRSALAAKQIRGQQIAKAMSALREQTLTLFGWLIFLAFPIFPLVVGHTTLEARAGFSSYSWLVCSLLFAQVIFKRHEWCCPEVLTLVPAEPELLSRMAQLYQQRKMRWILVGSGCLSIIVTTAYAINGLRDGFICHWEWVPISAFLGWLHLAVFAVVLPPILLAFTKLLTTLKVGSFGLILTITFYLGAVLMLLAPLILNSKEHQLAERIGTFLYDYLIPGRFLLWPIHMERVPWLQLGITLGGLFIFWPKFKLSLTLWREAPLVPAIYGSQNEWDDIDDWDATESPSNTTVTNATTDGSILSPVELATALRTHIDASSYNETEFLLPPISRWQERFHLGYKSVLIAVAFITLAGVLGHMAGVIISWIWLTLTCYWTGPKAPKLRVFNPVSYSPQNGLTTANEWLPISMLPSWKLLQRDHHLNMLTGFLMALFIALPVALIARATQSLAKYSPWYQEEAGSLNVTALAICMPAFVLGLGLLKRVRLPSRFAAKLLNYSRFRGFWTRALCVVSSLLGMLNLILVLLACLLAIPCGYFGNAPQVLWITIPGLLLVAEILRYIHVKMIIWTWNHGKRK